MEDMERETDSPYKGSHDMGRHLNIASLDQEIEIIDAESLKRRLTEQRTSVMKADGNTAQVLMYKSGTHKTKALTSQTASSRDFNKIIVYCPMCQSFGNTQRMMPHKLEVLLSNPEAYTKLVGGLAFEDDTIFLHCSRCDLRLLPSVDEVEKLDARTEEEYEITSLADVNRMNQKPIITGQSGRYNKLKSKKEQDLERRKRIVKEQMTKDYEQHKEGVKPSE